MAEWSALVTLNGEDVSGRLVGRINVEAEESTSRVSSFTILPLSGLIQAGDWIGADATIDYIFDPNGSPVQTRLFNGNVNKAVFDPTSGFVSFECTDNLQGHFEVMTETQILSSISGGRYAVEVFGEREDGWQQAVDVLSTVEKGYDLNSDGVTPALTDWEAKVTADYSYNNSTVIDASVETDITRLRDLINTVTISAEYRFTRLHHREHDFSWAAKIGLNGGFDFCDYFANSYELPTRDMVQGAGAAGWTIKNDSITFETLPVTGSYNCGGTVGWIISEELLNQLVVDAEWTVVRRWSQTITESYSLTIQDGGSVNQHGPLVYEDGAGWQTDFDDSGWDSSTGTEIPVGWTQNAIGDYTEDQIDRSNADNVLLTLIQIGKSRICQSHRQNFVSWETELEPAIERSDTAEISSSVVSAKGKVFQYVHIMDIDAGSATSNIKVAVSKTWDGGSDGSLFTPLVPDTDPTHTPPSTGTSLDNRIGNDAFGDVFDENWTGFTGNFTVAQNGIPSEDQIYPRRFRVQTSDIEDESRNEVSNSSLQTYDIKCPDETLVLTVGLGPGESITLPSGSSVVNWTGFGDQTLEGSFSSIGLSSTFFQGQVFVVTESDFAISGSATLSASGSSILGGDLSSTGIASTALFGSDGDKPTVLTASGVSTVDHVSASIVDGIFSSVGTSSVDASSSIDSAVWSSVGSSVVSGVSNTQTFNEMIAGFTSRVNHWRLGESSGTTASDEESSLDLTYTNTPTLGATGAFSNDSDTAVTFVDTNSEDASVSSTDFRIGDSSGCIMGWFNFDGSTSSIVFASSESSTLDWFVALFCNTDGEIRLILKKSGPLDQNIITSTTSGLDDSNWHFVVLQSNGSSYDMYIDGQPETFTVDDGTDNGDWFSDVSNRDNVSIGSLRRSTIDYSSATIDEVVILDDTLTDQEVLDLYNAGIWT